MRLLILLPFSGGRCGRRRSPGTPSRRWATEARTTCYGPVTGATLETQSGSQAEATEKGVLVGAAAAAFRQLVQLVDSTRWPSSSGSITPSTIMAEPRS